MGGIQFEERRRIRRGISHRTGTGLARGAETRGGGSKMWSLESGGREGGFRL